MATDQSHQVLQPPFICQLRVSDVFNGLTPQQKLYAHHMARAAWHGTRIILQQVSPESSTTFDLIMELYCSCNGDWPQLATKTDVSLSDLDRFLDYAATFLANIGNYYGKGDQKFVPDVSSEVLQRLATVSQEATELYQKVAGSISNPQPGSLGFPSEVAQSAYYPGSLRITAAEIGHVSKVLEENSIHQENTRIMKLEKDDGTSFNVLQASVDSDAHPQKLSKSSTQERIYIQRGDYSRELRNICAELEQARKYAANSSQKELISKYVESFGSGDMEPYKESQRIWVKDTKPAVETVMGFVEPYRDPFGVRAEFEGLVGIVHPEETKALTALAENSSRFIRRLPWAENATENEGKGPFEKALFEAPDFTSVHVLAYCSSIIFPGVNLPNYNDIRDNVGSKNLMIPNSINVQRSRSTRAAACVHPTEVDRYLTNRDHAFYLWVVFHELLGHGTGKLLAQDGPDTFNFDVQNPPTNPLTNKPVECWYAPGQTWTGVFGDIATSVDECRAECVGTYLMSDKEILAMFGYTDETEITTRDLEYNMYMQLGVAGLRALENYNIEDHKWGQAHSRAHFGMFKCLLATEGNFMTVDHDRVNAKLTVQVDQAKIATHGRPALRELLLRLHIYRCTADVKACRAFYEPLTEPEGQFLEWRRIMLANQEPRQLFVQANTFIQGDGQVVLKEYETTTKGLIRSWAERCI